MPVPPWLSPPLMAAYFKFKLYFWPAEYTFSHSGGEQQRHWHPAYHPAPGATGPPGRRPARGRRPGRPWSPGRTRSPAGRVHIGTALAALVQNCNLCKASHASLNESVTSHWVPPGPDSEAGTRQLDSHCQWHPLSDRTGQRLRINHMSTRSPQSIHWVTVVGLRRARAGAGLQSRAGWTTLVNFYFEFGKVEESGASMLISIGSAVLTPFLPFVYYKCEH